MRKSRPSVYETITAQIIEAIEQGAGDWQMPWRQYDRPLHRPANIDTSNRYRGINVLSLWVAAWTKNYSSGVWGTYRQWLKADCQVRRGEKSTSVVFYKQIESDEKPEQTDQDATQVRLIARASSVFNAEQVDGYTPPTPPDTTNQVEPVQAAQDFVTATAARIIHGGNRAYFDTASDTIHIPPTDHFTPTESSTATEAYWGTVLHELTHWSGGPTRCNRNLKGRFGDDAYSAEELVAEIGAAFLCADLGITTSPRQDHAAYIAHWLRILKEDNRAIFNAASLAARATDYLFSLQPDSEKAAS